MKLALGKKTYSGCMRGSNIFWPEQILFLVLTHCIFSWWSNLEAVLESRIYHNSRQLKAAKMCGRAGAKKRETAGKRSAEPLDDPKIGHKSPARKKTRNFRALETNGRPDGNKKAFP